ncbi:aldo/keto reductase [Pelagicoccus sp. SDUM812003]|uniref:aldo/keto reductase n=1 Tax=Pelagicoccus sp. SDUM812003 TaxID=3041267 RepID=UPI00280F3C2B|nr:aldo/keto reductase [Pelagicoccus sp. SDUM812003]MDQ8203101.1 aldo/keto reductase [Pelagicoccus sp. SDUM812003]
MERFEGTCETREEGLSRCVTLSNGVEMPWLGLGVFEVDDNDLTETIVRQAIERGYRSIDTAALYGNERGVGAAIRTCGLPREQVFVTSKVWNTEMRSDRVEQAFEESMKRLGLDYVDLFLLHWPIEGKIVASWTALERFYREGRIRAIGVSNFLPRHLEEIETNCDEMPVVNQIEYHPYLQSLDLKRYCEERSIRVEAWSPFMHGGGILRDPTLSEIAESYQKSVAQVIVRWILQTGVATIPKTQTASRMVENSDVFDFELSDSDMRRIADLERGMRWGGDPNNFDF